MGAPGLPVFDRSVSLWEAVGGRWVEHSGLLAERSKASGKVYAVDGVPVDYSSALYVVPWVLGPVRALNLRRLFDRYRRAWFTVDHVEALPARNLVRLEVVSYAGALPVVGGKVF